MKPLVPLIFPDTVVKPALTLPLLAFFDKLRHYMPIPLEDSQGPALPGMDRLESSTPVSLGEDLPRFKMLLKDLTGHENEYLGGYLSSLSGFSTDVDEAAVWSIFKKLSGDQKDQEDRRQRETIWQSLLLLKLAELLSREEEIIAAGLAGVEESQARLLAELKGDDDEEDELFVSGETTADLPGEFFFDFGKLCRAWAQLFLRDPKRDEAWLLLTPHREAAALVLDTYESWRGRPPQCFLHLPLPEIGRESSESAEPLLETLKNKGRESLRSFNRLLWQTATAEDEKSLPALFEEITQVKLAWEQEIIGSGLDLHDSPGLDFYFLKDTSLPHLFAELVGTPAETPGSSLPVSRHGILAVLV